MALPFNCSRAELVKYVSVKTGHDILKKKLHKYQEVMDVRIADMVLFDFPNIITVILIFGIFATGVMYTKKMFVWVRLFCSTPLGSYCFVITNPALHTGLLKFDYFVVF